MSPLIITDGNCRLVVDTDPGTHRLRVTMQEWEFGYFDANDTEGAWIPLGCVSMDRERAEWLATELVTPVPFMTGDPTWDQLDVLQRYLSRQLVDARAAADNLQARLDVAEQKLDTERALRTGLLR